MVVAAAVVYYDTGGNPALRHTHTESRGHVYNIPEESVFAYVCHRTGRPIDHCSAVGITDPCRDRRRSGRPGLKQTDADTVSARGGDALQRLSFHQMNPFAFPNTNQTQYYK